MKFYHTLIALIFVVLTLVIYTFQDLLNSYPKEWETIYKLNSRHEIHSVTKNWDSRKTGYFDDMVSLKGFDSWTVVNLFGYFGLEIKYDNEGNVVHISKSYTGKYFGYFNKNINIK